MRTRGERSPAHQVLQEKKNEKKSVGSLSRARACAGVEEEEAEKQAAGPTERRDREEEKEGREKIEGVCSCVLG